MRVVPDSPRKCVADLAGEGGFEPTTQLGRHQPRLEEIQEVKIRPLMSQSTVWCAPAVLRVRTECELRSMAHEGPIRTLGGTVPQAHACSKVENTSTSASGVSGNSHGLFHGHCCAGGIGGLYLLAHDAMPMHVERRSQWWRKEMKLCSVAPGTRRLIDSRPSWPSMQFDAR